MRAGEKLFALLSGASAVAALVTDDSGPRIYPGIAREAAATPFLVYNVLTDHPQLSLGGDTSGLHRIMVQIDAFSRQYDEAQQLADAVEGTLRALVQSVPDTQPQTAACRLDRVDEYDNEMQQHRVRMDFSIWAQEG